MRKLPAGQRLPFESELAQASRQVRNVRYYGAKGNVTTVGSTGTDDTDAFNKAIENLPRIAPYGTEFPCGVIYLPQGIYLIEGDLDEIGPFVSIVGEGHGASIINYRGSANGLVHRAPTDWDYTIVPEGGNHRGFTITSEGVDWTSWWSDVAVNAVAGVAGAGFQIGDLNCASFDDVEVHDFPVCLQGFNSKFCCEVVTGNLRARDGGFGILLTADPDTVEDATNSFIRWDLVADITGTDYCFTVTNGAIYSGRTFLRGYLYESCLTTPYVIGLFGEHPTVGNPSCVDAMEFSVEVEQANDVYCAGTPAGHMTIHFDPSHDVFFTAAGSMSFAKTTGTFVQSDRYSATDDGSNFFYTGPVYGDYALGSAQYAGSGNNLIQGYPRSTFDIETYGFDNLVIPGEWDAVSSVQDSNDTTTSTSLQSTSLVLPVENGGLYEIEAVLLVESTSSQGMKVGINGPGGSSLAAVLDGATSATAAATCGLASLNSASSSTFAAVANTPVAVTIKGFLNAGADGNITVQFEKVTSGTATLLIGSQLKIRQLN
jgi:hypothetical protein